MIKLGNFNVVLDACVLYDSYLRDFLLRLAEQELYQPFWSSIICDEVKRNLLKRNIIEGKVNRLISFMNEAFPESMIDNYSTLPSLTNIEINDKDVHVVSAALSSNSQVIVTCNLKDFPNEILNKYSIEAQSPDIFLRNLFHLSHSKVINAFKEMHKTFHNPPVSIEELISIFKTRVPTFTASIKPFLDESIIKF